jgi:hypothetical protein
MSHATRERRRFGWLGKGACALWRDTGLHAVLHAVPFLGFQSTLHSALKQHGWPQSTTSTHKAMRKAM